MYYGIIKKNFRINLKFVTILYNFYKPKYHNNMLPKDYRLKKRSAFAATYRIGNTIHKDGITVFIGKNKNDELPTRVGFVVSKKIHKRAVKRNRIKRLMRESYRLLIKNKTISNEHKSLIFVASSKLLGKNFTQINSAMTSLVNRL